MAGRIIDILILDNNFNQVDVVDYYTSLNWHVNMLGDGQVEMELPIDNTHDLSYIQRNHYLARKDDDMLAVITYTETREGVDTPDILYVKALDFTKVFLNKRIVWVPHAFAGRLTVFIGTILDENFMHPAIEARKILATDGTPLLKYTVVGTAGSELMTYKTQNDAIGDLVEMILSTFRYGMRLVLERENGVVHLNLKVFRPSNRSSYVIFNKKFDNVVNTNFTSEYVRGSNVIMVGGEVNGSSRYYQSVGSLAKGMDRNEEFLDAKDLSSKISWEDLMTQYPPQKKVYDFPTDPTGAYTVYFQYTDEDGKTYDRWYYRMAVFKMAVQDEDHFDTLRSTYKNYDWFHDVDSLSGISYFCVRNADVAICAKDIINDPPEKDEEGNYTSNPTCTAMEVLYKAMLLQKGYEVYQEGTLDTAFSAEIDPYATFHYNRDYILGDYVGIYNNYGIKAAVQITDMTETIDPSGYHFDVTLSNAKSKDVEEVVIYCATDAVDTVYILTDDGSYICL